MHGPIQQRPSSWLIRPLAILDVFEENIEALKHRPKKFPPMILLAISGQVGSKKKPEFFPKFVYPWPWFWEVFGHIQTICKEFSEFWFSLFTPIKNYYQWGSTHGEKRKEKDFFFFWPTSTCTESLSTNWWPIM
jgi:hypothetical protein